MTVVVCIDYTQYIRKENVSNKICLLKFMENLTKQKIKKTKQKRRIENIHTLVHMK